MRHRELSLPSSFLFPPLCVVFFHRQQNIFIPCVNKTLDNSKPLFDLRGTLLWGISPQWMDFSAPLAQGPENLPCFWLLDWCHNGSIQDYSQDPLLAHRNWLLYRAVCKARSQASECGVSLSWARTAWLICDRAHRSSDFITRGKACLIQRLLLVKLPQELSTVSDSTLINLSVSKSS